MPLPNTYTTTEIAERYRVTAHTVTDWIRKGCPTSAGRVKLPANKFGRKWQITDEDLLLFEHRARPSSNERPGLDPEGDPVE